MKALKLSLSRIGHYFVANRLVLVFYLAGSITCILAFIFFWGNYLSVKKAEAGDGYAYRTYGVHLAKPQELLTEDIEQLLKENDIADIVLESEVERLALDQEAEENQTIPVQASYLQNAPFFARAGRVTFSEQERNEGAFVMVLPDGYTDLFQQKEIDFLGEPYQFVGVQEDSAILIPYQTFLRMSFGTSRMIITLNHKLSPYESSVFSDELFQKFPGSKIDDPWLAINKRSQGQLPVEMAILIATFLLALFSFIFKRKYIQDENTRENVIYSMAGASRRAVLKVMLLDSMILSSASSLLAILLHVALYQSLFRSLNTVSNLTYSVTDYVLLFALTVLLSVLTIGPFLLHSLKQLVISFYYKTE